MNALAMLVAVFGPGPGADPAQRLPAGPAPIQILARMDDKGNLVLVIPYTVYVKEGPAVPGGGYRIVPEAREETRSVPFKEVTVYETDGKEADRRRLPGVLRGRPVPVLLSADGKPVDPLHLRLVKDGTLIFAGPTPKVGTFKFEDK